MTIAGEKSRDYPTRDMAARGATSARLVRCSIEHLGTARQNTWRWTMTKRLTTALIAAMLSLGALNVAPSIASTDDDRNISGNKSTR
jgi:hypothetical protein